MVHFRIAHRLGLIRSTIFAAALGLALQSGLAMATAQVSAPPIEVVASFSVLGDMVKEIGGNSVSVTTIVGPNADAHTFEPAPQAVQTLGKAQVLVSNGLDFEAWLPRLIASSGFSGMHIVASDGAQLRTFQGDPVESVKDSGNGVRPHSHSDSDADHGTSSNHAVDPDAHDHGQHVHQAGDIDPHAWQNLENGMVYAQNIADGLSLADPARAPNYQRRLKKYLATMQKLDAEVRTALSAIPAESRKAVTAHDAFGYFGDAYDVTFIPLAALGDTAEPSAKDMAAIIDRIRQEDRIGVFPEKTSNTKLIEQLGREADIVVGGALYSDALDQSDEPAGTYLGMFHWNAGQLITVLKSEPAVRPN